MNNVKLSIIIVLVFVVLLLLPICNHYGKMSYSFDFAEILKYEDIFFETNNSNYGVYGIGSYDIYADRLIEKELNAADGEPPYSKTQKYYEKRRIEMYPEFLIENRNEILSKCSFQKVSFGKSFLLSMLFNYLNNITTIRINEGYLSQKLNNNRFSKDILQDLLDKRSGVVDAGVFYLFGKAYIMTDYIFFEETNAESFDYKKDVSIKKLVFEVIPSEEMSELVERKYSSQASFVDSYRASPIRIWNFLLLLICLIVVLRLRRKKGIYLMKSK